MSHPSNKSLQVPRKFTKAIKSTIIKEFPKWARECITSPSEGVLGFLEELRKTVNAPYAHIRVCSRSGIYYTLVESIGIYKKIGRKRRHHLLDKKERSRTHYQFIDNKTSEDCKALINKYEINTLEYNYLNSLTHGLLIPLYFHDIELGYVTLSWDTEIKGGDAIINSTKKYIRNITSYIPFVYQACRSIIVDEQLSDLWANASVILSTADEYECYDRIAEACIKFWGNVITVYIGKVSDKNTHIDVVKVAGRRADEAEQNIYKHNIPLDKGIFGFLLNSDKPLLAYSISNDNRFTYHSMRKDGGTEGSAIATKLSDSSNKNIVALMSIEHELENVFDIDDLRFLTAIARIGYENITAYQGVYKKTSRKFDALYTQVAHDIIEPLQAIVSDAEVLKYEAADGLNYSYKSINIEKYLSSISLRADNFLEEALNLHKIMKRYLDIATDDSPTRITDGVIRLYPLLNAFTDQWRSRAESQGIQIRSLYDSLRDVKVSCDEAELKSTLGHLIGNSIKYSFWGRMKNQDGQSKFGRHIKIIGRKKMGMAIIEFENFGIGILNDEIKLITEKYYRGKLAIKEGKAGTGRGLWTVKNFLDSINGYLEVTSNPNTDDINGPYSNSFNIHLPIYKSKENKDG